MSDRNLRIRLLFEGMDRLTKPLREIAGGAGRASQALKVARDRVKELDRASADVASFRERKTAIGALEAEMKAAQTRVGQLAREMAAADNPTKKLATEFARAKREAAGLKTEHAQESAQLQTLRGRLDAAGISTNRLAERERELRQETARANTELTEQTRRLKAVEDRSARFAAGRDRFGRVQGAAAGMAAGGASALASGYAVGRPILGAIGDAMEYESVMTDVAQKASLSREEARKMGLGLIAAAKSANQLPESLAAGVDVLSGFGLDPRQAVAMMTPIGRAATAYKAEIADLSAAAFAANDNLKVPIDQTARVIDVMAAAGKAGAFEMKDMARHFPSLTAGYQALGQSGVSAAGDIAAALQIARKGTGDADSAATNISNLLQKMGSPDTIRKFKKFGVDLPAALKRAYAAGKTPIEAITELTNKTLKGDLSRLGFLFEDAQVQQALRPLIQNVDEYRRIRADALNAKGVVDADFAERLKDGSDRARQFRINARALALTMGGVLLPTVNRVMEAGARLAGRLGAWADRHPRLAKWIGITAAGVAALMIVLGGGAILVAGLLAPFAALSFAAGALGIGLLPVIGIAAGVVAGIGFLAGAVYLIYQNWSGISAWFSGIWTQLKTAFDGGLWGVIGLLHGWADSFFSGIRSAVVIAFQWMMANGPALASQAWGLIQNVLWNGVLLLPRLFFQFGQNTVTGFIRGIGSMLGNLKSTIVNAASSAAAWFKNKLGIRSPSRVFMGLGGFVMQGLARGIDDGGDAPVDRLAAIARRMTMAVSAVAPAAAIAAAPVGLPPSLASGASDVAQSIIRAAPDRLAPRAVAAPLERARALSRQMEAAMARGAPARPVAPPASRSAGGAAVGSAAPLTIEAIHIHAAPGQSPQDIARAVRAEIAALDRERRARDNSSFADRPDWRED